MNLPRKRHPDIRIFLAAILLGLAVLACGTSPSPAKDGGASGRAPTNAPASSSCLQDVTAGTTTRQGLIAALGTPAQTEVQDNQEMLLYATTDSGQYHSIVVQNNIVGLVSVLLDENAPLVWSTVRDQYGNPPITTYSYFLEGTRTYVYPAKGQAFVASPDLDIVYARECFVPMSADDYMSSWGSSLPTENPFPK